LGFKPLTGMAQREHERLNNDLRYFCKTAMKIKLKGGGEAPFIWNKAQEYLHARIEDQLARTGKVRMFIIKGRQQGISTYIAARLYHKITRQRGKNVFILSHIATTTETLFQIVDRYHTNCPPEITPKTVVNNNRRLKFTNGSQYTVGTAGSGSIGRGDTNQFLHWSEVAFCDNIPELLTGVVQTVADIDGTEQLFESTANGVGNYFHTGCTAAARGGDEFEITFIPWHWQPEYRARLGEGFELTDEEIKLKQMYGLDDNQIQWRRNKIKGFEKAGFGPSKFKQEYPFTIAEAFQASGDKLFNADKVAEAKKCNLTDEHAPLILGVDPGPINDRTTITWRRGRHWIKTEVFLGVNQMELAGKLIHRLERNNIAAVFVDVAEGRGCVDRCKELGYGDTVKGVSFANSPNDDVRYVNKRAEMHGDAKEWLEDELGVRIPDIVAENTNLASGDQIELELGIIPPFRTTSNGKLQMVAKDEIIKLNNGKSPDLVDSFILTFAQHVRNTYNQGNQTRQKRTSELSAVNRRRRANPKEAEYDDYDAPRTTRVRKALRRR
jgi:hypothetical protein